MHDWPLVGRSTELSEVSDLLTSKRSRGVVLAGPTGVGKTRLAQECLRSAEAAGMATAQVTATRSAGRLPFGAVAPLLPTGAPVPTGAPPVAGGSVGPGTAEGWAGLLQSSLAALADRGKGRRLVLCVDDAHLLDDASADLVHRAAVAGVAVVLATVGAAEPAPAAITSLWEERVVPRVGLEPLDEAASEELLVGVLQGPIGPAAAAQLMARGRGNALFLRELALGAREDGNLYEDRGTWRLRRALAPSQRLVEIVEARLVGLDERERALMEVAAYGEPLGRAGLVAASEASGAPDRPGPTAALSALSAPERSSGSAGSEPSDASDASDAMIVDALERRGLLAGELDGRRFAFRLAHPVYGDVIRARTPALRARRVRAALAGAVEATGCRRQDDTLRVATWCLGAGGGSADVLLGGARAAAARFDFPLAERLAQAAGDAGAGFDAALLAARAIGRQGRRDEAEAIYARLAAEAGDDARRGRVAVARFYNSIAYAGRDEEKVLDEAEASITDPRWRAEVATRRLTVVLNAYGFGAAVEAARPLLDRATGPALAFTSVVGGYALTRTGRLDEAREVAARGRAAQEGRPGDQEGRPGDRATVSGWWYTVIDCIALAFAGRFAEAEALAEEQHRLATRDGATEAQALLAGMLASTAGERGRPHSALHRAREALWLNRRLGRPLLMRQNYVHGATALALAGRPEEAAEELAAFDTAGTPPVARDEVDVLLARAWVAAAAGDLPRARAFLEQAAERGEQFGDRVGESRALHGLARLGRPGEVVGRLGELASGIDGELSGARAGHARALAAGSAEALEESCDAFERMGADLLAAEAAADAAVVRRRAGEARAGAADEMRSAELAERCENPVTPALQATEARARLTPAEREAAALAAGGRSNKQIAETLDLSPRTVENRLQRVYEKLGIAGRAELSDAFAAEE